MRRLLLSGVASLPLLSGGASAQGIPVYDNASLLKQAAVWLQQANDMKRQSEQLVATTNALAHTSSVQGAAGIAGGLGRQVAPPGNQIPGLLNGQGGTWGTAEQRLGEDRVYAPNDGSEWAVEQERRERVTSNAKSAAEAAYLDIDNQIAELEGIQAEVEGAEDVTAVAAQSAAIGLVKMRLDASRGQLEQVRLLLAADDRVIQQRSEQMWRRDVDDWALKSQAAGAGW